jgi:dipeptidase E
MTARIWLSVRRRQGFDQGARRDARDREESRAECYTAELLFDLMAGCAMNRVATNPSVKWMCFGKRDHEAEASQLDTHLSGTPDTMKLLLTSAGIKNASIRQALLELLGKPIADCNALCIPTAGYGYPQGNRATNAWRFISGREPDCPMCELEWKSMGVLELTALPSIGAERWVPWVREADVLLVNGGDTPYLCYWMRKSGLASLLPTLDRTVWVGLSAGSMVMTPRIGEKFVATKPPITGDDRTLGVVDFSIFPHLDHPQMPGNNMAAAERWAVELGGPAYAMDDQTAIKVVDGVVEVVSEGNWKLLGAERKR